MKKHGGFWIIVGIFLIVVVLTMAFFPNVFGNKKIIDTKWNYNIAVIDFGDEVIRVNISSWTEDDNTFTIITEDGTVYCTHQKNVVMIKEK